MGEFKEVLGNLSESWSTFACNLSRHEPNESQAAPWRWLIMRDRWASWNASKHGREASTDEVMECECALQVSQDVKSLGHSGPGAWEISCSADHFPCIIYCALMVLFHPYLLHIFILPYCVPIITILFMFQGYWSKLYFFSVRNYWVFKTGVLCL